MLREIVRKIWGKRTGRCENNTPITQTAPRRKLSWTRWVRGLLCAAAAAAITFGLIELFFPTRIPPSFQGKWVVVDGAVDLHGDMLEIFADGTMIARKKGTGGFPRTGGPLNPQQARVEADDHGMIRGWIRVDDNILRLTASNPLTGNEVNESQTILDVTQEQLVVGDAQGELLIMKRVR